VSRICSGLDDEAQAFRDRPIIQAVRYLWLDATYVKVRQRGAVVSMALVLAAGVRADGYRETLGWDIGHAEDKPFWAEFLRRLVRRGLREVHLVTSDAPEGLTKAIAHTLTGDALAAEQLRSPLPAPQHRLGWAPSRPNRPSSGRRSVLRAIDQVCPSSQHLRQRVQRKRAPGVLTPGLGGDCALSANVGRFSLHPGVRHFDISFIGSGSRRAHFRRANVIVAATLPLSRARSREVRECVLPRRSSWT